MSSKDLCIPQEGNSAYVILLTSKLLLNRNDDSAMKEIVLF